MSTPPEVQVLIVEDEEGIRENLRDLLEDAGYRVAVAADGAAALRELQAHRPMLVILDLLLPLVSGNELYSVMQKTPGLQSIPVLVTTSDPTASPPGVPILAKPIDIEALLRMVALCTHGPDPAYARPRR